MIQSGVPGTVKMLVPRERRRQDLESSFADLQKDLLGEVYEALVYELGECRVIVAREPSPDGIAWHLSISHPSRYPTWDEIKTARYRLTPSDVTMAMILPPPDEYVNVEAQDNVFHLWQIPGEAKGRS